MCSAPGKCFNTFAPKMQEQNKNRSRAELAQIRVLTLNFGSNFGARYADFPLVLTVFRPIDPLNINVICIDFNGFPPVSRCNRMSFWHSYLKYQKISSDNVLTFTVKNLRWANISKNTLNLNVKMTLSFGLQRIPYVDLYNSIRRINLINRQTALPAPIMKSENRRTKQTSTKETPL